EPGCGFRPCKFGRNFYRTVIPSFRPPRIDLGVATFGPTKFAEPLHESSEPWPANRRGGRTQESESSHSLLLRACRERPYRGCAAEQRDDLASSEVEHGLLPGTRCASLPQAQDAPEAPAGHFASRVTVKTLMPVAFLRACRERPYRGCAAEQRDELA